MGVDATAAALGSEGGVRAVRRRGHQARYRQIARVLLRHGLGGLASALGLTRGGLRPPLASPPTTPPVHLREAMEELGTTFIKLAQVLSTRPDLLPPAYVQELAKLQDAAPHVEPAVVRATVEAELGRPLADVFAAFDPDPLAAASIGQAHGATLHDGTAVVVKVRRPGVVAQVEEDLAILQHLATVAQRRWSLARDYDIVGLTEAFARTLRAELDYVQEGHNAEHFAAILGGDAAVRIPRIFWQATTARVLTLERLDGIKIDDLEALDAAGIDRHALAERATHLFCQTVFEDGFFHADPHPGNFFIEPNGRIGLIDFGMVGRIDGPLQASLVRLIVALTQQDAERLLFAFLDLGVARHVDRVALRRDLGLVLSRYYGRSLGDLSIGVVFGELMEVVRRHHLTLPADLALLVKALVMSEGVALRLDPTFHPATILGPYARRLVRRQLAPRAWAKRLGDAGLEAAWAGVELPGQVRRLLADLQRGDLDVGVRPVGFEPVLERLERLTNRIVLGVLTAAFIVGVAVLHSGASGDGLGSWVGPMLTVGFVLASTLGAYLAWSIVRSEQRR